MPSLFRFMLNLTAIGMLGYVGLLALANLVEPQQHEIVAVVPLRSKPDVKPMEHVRTRTATKTVEPGEGRHLFTTLESLPFASR